MSVISARVGNFLKVFSMFLVIGSLIYMYSYDTDRVDLITMQPEQINSFSKVQVFYIGLGFFVAFNLIIHLLMHLYNGTKGIDPNSLIFRSKKQKSAISAGLSFLLAGINIFIAGIILYIAFTRINEVAGQSAWIYIPVAGFTVLLITAATFIRAVFQK